MPSMPTAIPSAAPSVPTHMPTLIPTAPTGVPTSKNPTGTSKLKNFALHHNLFNVLKLNCIS